jgi:hypothetical protein
MFRGSAGARMTVATEEVLDLGLDVFHREELVVVLLVGLFGPTG